MLVAFSYHRHLVHCGKNIMPNVILKSFVNVFILLCLKNLSAIACDDYPRGLNTIAESKKYKLFIGLVSCTPNSFYMQGHNIKVKEAWLERGLIRQSDKKKTGNRAILCIKFLIDGKPEFGKRQTIELNVEYGSGYKCFSDVIISKLEDVQLVLTMGSKLIPGHIKHCVIGPKNEQPIDLRLFIAEPILNGNEKKNLFKILTFHLPAVK